MMVFGSWPGTSSFISRRLYSLRTDDATPLLSLDDDDGDDDDDDDGDDDGGGDDDDDDDDDDNLKNAVPLNDTTLDKESIIPKTAPTASDDIVSLPAASMILIAISPGVSVSSSSSSSSDSSSDSISDSSSCYDNSSSSFTCNSSSLWR